MYPGRRSQSEAVGIVLLVGVVVTVVFTASVFVAPQFLSGTDDPRFSIDAEATSQNVSVWHTGGDRVSTEDVEIVLRGGHTERYDLDSFTQERGADETQFERGDRWTRDHGIDAERMDVLVVHRPTNTVVRTTVDVEETLAPRFDWDPSNPTTLDTVEFDASRSSDTESDIVSYGWDFGDGTTDDGEIVTHEFDSSGTYEVTLTVETEDGRTGTRTRVVEIFNPAPRASLTFSPETPDTGEDITFDASDSFSPDGEIWKYEWDFDDANTTTTTESTVVHNFSSYGEYDVRLTIEDTNNETARTVERVAIRQAFFDVTIDDTTSPVREGETLSVNATVENTGGTVGVQDINLRDFDSHIVDTEEVVLGSGASEELTLTWADTSEVSPGVDNVTVASENDTVTVPVEITQVFANVGASHVAQSPNEDQDFVIELDSDLEAGETIVVDVSDTGTEVDYDSRADRYEVVEGSGSVETVNEVDGEVVSFEYTVGAGGETAGDTVVIEGDRVASANQAPQNSNFAVVFEHVETGAIAETSFVVDPPPLNVASVDPLDDGITEGDSLDVNVTVENTVDEDITDQQVLLFGDPNQDGTFVQVDSTEVSVGAGTSLTVTLTYDSQVGDAPAVDVRAETEDDTVGVTVTAVLDSLSTTDDVFLQDPIYEDEEAFNVTTENFDELNSTDGGFLVVENNRTGERYEVDEVGEQELSVDVDEVDGIEAGDVLNATLYESSDEENEMDADSTTVEPVDAEPGDAEFHGAVTVEYRDVGGGNDPDELVFEYQTTDDENVDRILFEATEANANNPWERSVEIGTPDSPTVLELPGNAHNDDIDVTVTLEDTTGAVQTCTGTIVSATDGDEITLDCTDGGEGTQSVSVAFDSWIESDLRV